MHIQKEKPNMFSSEFDVPSEEEQPMTSTKLPRNPFPNPNLRAIQMREMIERSMPFASPECCIYRVPETIANVNAKAYKPRLVSIGPFHYGLKKYKAMEGQKWQYADAYLLRARLSVEQCDEAVRKLEKKARNSYAEPIMLSSDVFATMLLVDACFIIELFLRSCLGGQKNQDLVLRVPRLFLDLDHDLILLENQVPFFILEEIYNLSPPSFPTMLELTFAYFKGYNKQNKQPQPEFEIKHFTDLLRKFHIQLAPAPAHQFQRKRMENFSLPRATELDAAGAIFEKDSSQCWLDIQFANNKKLKIPQLEINDGWESLIRNLVAFEQCHCLQREYYLSDYISFIKCLAKTPKDVDLFVQNGIIVNWLGDNEPVSNLLHRVCANIVISPSMFYYSGLCEELIAYCKKPWNSYKATLKRDYFKKPWRTATTIAVVVLLLLTCMQTITSISAKK